MRQPARFIVLFQELVSDPKTRLSANLTVLLCFEFCLMPFPINASHCHWLSKALFGDVGSGKASLLFRLIYGSFNESYSINAENACSIIPSSRINSDWRAKGWSESVELETPLDLETLTSMALVDAVIIVISIMERNAAEFISKWAIEARRLTMRSRKSVPIAVFGTNSDLALYAPDALLASQKHQFEYFEMSSKTGEGVLEAFEGLMRLVAYSEVWRKSVGQMPPSDLPVTSSTPHMDAGVVAQQTSSQPPHLHNDAGLAVLPPLQLTKTADIAEHTLPSAESSLATPTLTSPGRPPVSRLDALLSPRSTRRNLLLHSSEELRSREHLPKFTTENGAATYRPRSSRASVTLPVSPEQSKRPSKSKKTTSTGTNATEDLSPRVPTQIDFNKEVELDDHKRLLILSGHDLFVYKVTQGKKRLDAVVDVTMATVNRPNARSLKLVLVLNTGEQHRLRFGDEGALALFKGHMQVRVKTRLTPSARATVVLPPRLLSVIVVGTDALALLRTREDNQFCAECQKPSPEYAVTNLGIVICDDCALAHEEVSSSSSRVLSILNESWNPYLLELMMSISNEQSNSVWEHKLRLAEEDCSFADLPTRPSPDSAFDVKRAFIESKYSKRSLLDPFYLTSLLNMDDERPHMAMNFAIRLSVARTDLIIALVKFIAHGISSDYVIDSQALVVIACINGNYLALNYLLENGANPNIKDSLGGIPLDHAEKLDAKVESMIKGDAITPSEIFTKCSTAPTPAETSRETKTTPAKMIQATVSSSRLAIPDSIKLDIQFAKDRDERLEYVHLPMAEGKQPSDDDSAVHNKTRSFKRSTSSYGALGGEPLIPQPIPALASVKAMTGVGPKEGDRVRMRKLSKAVLGIKKAVVVPNAEKPHIETPSSTISTAPQMDDSSLEWPLASSLLLDYGATPRAYKIAAPTEEEEKKIAEKEVSNRGKAAKLLGLMETMESTAPPPSSPRSSFAAPKSPKSPRSPRSGIHSLSESLEFIPTGGLVENAVSPRGLRKAPARRTIALSTEAAKSARLDSESQRPASQKWVAVTSSPESASPIASPSRTPSSSFSDNSNNLNSSDASSPRSPSMGTATPMTTIPTLMPTSLTSQPPHPAPPADSVTPAKQYAQSTWRTSSPSLRGELLRSLAAPSSENLLKNSSISPEVPAYEANPIHTWNSTKLRRDTSSKQTE